LVRYLRRLVQRVPQGCRESQREGIAKATRVTTPSVAEINGSTVTKCRGQKAAIINMIDSAGQGFPAWAERSLNPLTGVDSQPSTSERYRFNRFTNSAVASSES
jgi:hypothetical protein